MTCLRVAAYSLPLGLYPAGRNERFPLFARVTRKQKGEFFMPEIVFSSYLCSRSAQKPSLFHTALQQPEATILALLCFYGMTALMMMLTVCSLFFHAALRRFNQNTQILLVYLHPLLHRNTVNHEENGGEAM